MNKHLPRTVSRLFFLASLIGAFCVTAAAQGLTNRTPETWKIQPQPSPTPKRGVVVGDAVSTIEADPLLFPPGTFPTSISDSRPDLAFYVRLTGASQVRVANSHGREEPFALGSVQKVNPASYQSVGRDVLYIIVPITESYSISFESAGPSMSLEILKGRGDVSYEAFLYNNLVLGKGRAFLRLGPTGVEPLRHASDPNSVSSVVRATQRPVYFQGKPTGGPEIRFEVPERNAESLVISIKAVGVSSAVKRISYSIDGKNEATYQGPIRVDRKQSKFMFAFVEDNSGNRTTSIFEFGKRSMK
jgi:hypothetical protein